MDSYEATFQRGESVSQIDAFLIPRRMTVNEAKVTVLDNDISDHRAIKLEVMIEVVEQKVEERLKLRVRKMRIDRIA